MQLAATFGVAALLLALIGVYGVVSYTVEQRKGELGLRLALGAEHLNLMRLVMRYGLIPVLLGLGVWPPIVSRDWRPCARPCVRRQRQRSRHLLVVCLLLIFTAALACLVPASRVLRLAPAYILRHE